MPRTDNSLPTEWIDEIPTRPSAFKARVICVALLFLVVFGAWVHDFAPTTVPDGEDASKAVAAAVATADAELESALEESAQSATGEAPKNEENTGGSEEETQEGEEEAAPEPPPAVLRSGPLGFIYELGPGAFERALSGSADVEILLEKNGVKKGIHVCFKIFGALGLLFAIAGIAGFFRSRITYLILRNVPILMFPVAAAYAYFVWNGLFAVGAADLEFMGAGKDRATILILWWQLCWPAFAMALYVGWVRVMTNCHSVYSAFCEPKEEPKPLPGDHVLEDLRTHGRDPRSRKSLYTSILTHVMILIVIPWLMTLGGCVEAYKVPKGSGEPAVSVMVKVQKKKKKKKTLSLRPNSAIIFDIPDLDDTEVDQMMEEQTQLTYEASANAKAGKIGKGGGDKGGWPEGMDDYKIRFIRLEHAGKGWDDGMNHTQADVNFLRSFAKATGFKKIARSGESHSIALLAKYPDDGFPPFVFLTGNSHMGRVSSRDAQILREYCLKGGMLIADAGSRTFDQSFRTFIRQVFPDKQLIDIADDDMLYQLPYGFPNGAPAFWHHGGRRAYGIKHEGRWVAFYHPGDMNDAWKSAGYTDVTPEMRESAMNLGINLVYYAFNQWDDAVAKAKK